MIVLISQYGFGNRLRSIGSLYEISKYSGHKLIVLWPIEEDMNAGFNDIFKKNDINIISLKINKAFHNFLCYFFRYSRKIRFLKTLIVNGQFILSHSKEEQINIYQRNRLILVRTCFESVKDYSLDNFKFREDIISQSILKLNNNIDKNNLIGIHIRRTDSIWSTENSPLYLFINKIKSELNKNGNTYFYLASDDNNEKKSLINIFGNHIITENFQNFDRNSIDGIKNSVIDMYNLSCCKKIYGSFGSSFSKIASIIGHSELELLSDDLDRESYRMVQNLQKIEPITLTRKEWIHYYLSYFKYLKTPFIKL